MNKKLHILFLSGWYPSRVSPSNGDFVQRHAEAVATKHKVTIVYVVTNENINKKEIVVKTINNVLTKIVYVPKVSGRFFKFFLFLKTYLNEINAIESFDLTHLNITFPKGIIALYLKLFKNKPYIISEHWSGYQYPNNKKIKFLEKVVTKIIIKKATFVCPVAKYLEKSMIAFGLYGNYYQIPNVVDTEIFNISSNKSKNFTITHVSGMDNKIKNVVGILSVISKLQNKIPNLEFNLIGSKSIKYKKLIHQLKIKNIHIIDQIPNIEVSAYLKKSNLFVLFSNYENLPCVIIESFSSGVPVISTNVGGINEYFPKNFGYLIKPNDETALQESILKIYNGKLIHNSDLMHQYSINNFGIKSISEQFTQLYLKCIVSEK